MNALRHYFGRRNGFVLFFVLLGLGVAILVATSITPYHAQPKTDFYESPQKQSSTTYYRATIEKIENDNMEIRLLDGPNKGNRVIVSANSFPGDTRSGTTVIVASTQSDQEYTAFTEWRLPFIIMLAALFFAIVVIIGRRRGLMSIIGLIVSLLVIAVYLIPQLISGTNAQFAMVSSAFIIATTSIIIAHGWRYQTILSLASVYLILIFTALVSNFAVIQAGLTGEVDEMAASASMLFPQIDMRGLLAGTITLITLGILDDVVTTQVATVKELHSTDGTLSAAQLYKKASSVGREHIASLVNTLALAYIGIGIPIVLGLMNNGLYASLPLLFNSEYIAQEVIRTLVASLGLVLAVPISTLFSAYMVKKYTPSRRWRFEA